ncbi:MAG: NERD domain-containing protein, partial [Spartobacteria bacterium]|nr:NERD domain-containing protein [Spartobacteria bacterium]
MKQDARIDVNKLAKIDGSPGAKPRLAGFVKASWPLLLMAFAVGYLLRAMLPVPAMSPAQVGVLAIILCVFFAWAILWSERHVGCYIKGAQGEEMVARMLMLLPATYRVFHGVNAAGKLPGGGDYDHVVVGPTGVYLVETKNWSGHITLDDGNILYDGQVPDHPPIPLVKEAVAAFRRRLDKEGGIEVQVQPVLCFAGENVQDGVLGSVGVLVCNASRLAEVILDSVELPLHRELQTKI